MSAQEQCREPWRHAWWRFRAAWVLWACSSWPAPAPQRRQYQQHGMRILPPLDTRQPTPTPTLACLRAISTSARPRPTAASVTSSELPKLKTSLRMPAFKDAHSRRYTRPIRHESLGFGRRREAVRSTYQNCTVRVLAHPLERFCRDRLLPNAGNTNTKRRVSGQPSTRSICPSNVSRSGTDASLVVVYNRVLKVGPGLVMCDDPLALLRCHLPYGVVLRGHSRSADSELVVAETQGTGATRFGAISLRSIALLTDNDRMVKSIPPPPDLQPQARRPPL